MRANSPNFETSCVLAIPTRFILEVLMSFDDIFFNCEYRWPKDGDRLLRQPTRSEDGVRFVDFVHSREVFIWDGYMKAGAVLVQRAIEESYDRDALVFPILFNYRHGLEVAIKWVLDRYGRHAAMDEYEKNHRLDKLWQACRQVISEFGGDGPDNTADIVEGIVMEFHKLDPNSFAFRYSKDKKGVQVPLPNFLIDLENIRDVMEGVNHFFEGVDAQCSELSSALPSSH